MKNKCVHFSKNLSMVFLTIACFACSSEQAGLNELERLCETDAGLTIYKTVEADGFYDASRKAGALRTLIPSNFGFTEFCNYEPNITSLFDEPGCWRLTKVPRETGQCNERVNGVMESSGGGGYPEFLEEHCIMVEIIEKPSALYSYHEGLKIWSAKNGVSEFIRSYVQLREVGSGEVLSEYISYSYNKRPRHTSPQSCHLIDDKFPSFVETNIVEKSIISYRER